MPGCGSKGNSDVENEREGPLAIGGEGVSVVIGGLVQPQTHSAIKARKVGRDKAPAKDLMESLMETDKDDFEME